MYCKSFLFKQLTEFSKQIPSISAASCIGRARLKRTMWGNQPERGGSVRSGTRSQPALPYCSPFRAWWLCPAVCQCFWIPSSVRLAPWRVWPHNYLNWTAVPSRSWWVFPVFLGVFSARPLRSHRGPALTSSIGHRLTGFLADGAPSVYWPMNVVRVAEYVLCFACN